jgi:hypothetical protein
MISAEEAYIKSLHNELEFELYMITMTSRLGRSSTYCPMGISCETEFKLINSGYRLTKGNMENKAERICEIFGTPYDKSRYTEVEW